MLSARALAAFLASQKQPEKSLCPHVSEKHSNLSNDSSHLEHLGNDLGTRSEPLTDPRIQVGSRVSSELLEISKTEDRPNDVEIRIEEQHDHSVDVAGARREKDLKSFAQVLFDTFAMRRLYLDDSPCAMSPTLYPNITLTIEEENDTAKQADLIASATFAGKDQNITHMKPRLEMSQSHTEHCEANEKKLYRKQRRAWKALHLGNLESRGFGFDNIVPVDDLRAVTNNTLAYFTSMNVLSVLSAHYEWDVDLDVYTMLQDFNRDSCHLKSSRPSPKGLEQHERYSAFFRRSAGYIFKTRSAMLRSFVEWKQDDCANITARSYPLPTITGIIGCIRLCDDSEAMMSSLWAGIGDVYMQCPASVGSYDPTNHLQDGEQRFGAKLSKALSDTEAAHIVTIAMAALIHTVADVVANAMEPIQQLRSKGQERQLYVEGTPSRAPVHKYDPALVIMDHFGDGLACSLAVRLAKAMVSRQWIAKRTSHGCTKLPARAVKDCRHASFMTLVVRAIANKRGLQVGVSSSELPPSLQDGVLQDAMKSLEFREVDFHTNGPRPPHHLCLIIDWMRVVILKEWDGSPEVPRYGAVGGAMEFLKHLCKDALLNFIVNQSNSNKISIVLPATFPLMYIICHI